MAYDYNKYKNAYLGLTDDQRKQWDTKYGETAEYKQFKSDYSNEQNNVYTPSTTQKATTGNYIYGDTGGASSSSKYTGTGVSGGGNFQYNSSINTEKLGDINMLFGSSAEQYESQTPGYLEKRNNAIANALYNEGKTDRASVENYLNNFSGYTSYDKAGQQNTVDAIMNRIGSNTGQNNGNNTNSLNAGMMNDMGTNYNNYKNGYSNLMGGSSNYASNFDEAVLNKLRTAYGIESLDEFKQRYPEQYNSLMQSLETIRPVRDATNPSQRQMLDGQLQGVIGTGVGAGSDWSKLNVLESSILNKFENPEQIKQDAQNIIKLQTEGKSIGEIASEMGMSEDQVQQLVLLANGLDSKAGEYYKLTDKASKDITEPYDKKLDRAEIEKNIALERANRQVEWLKEDFDTNMERQQKANEVNLHNADFLSGQYGYGFSKRGIEGLQYTSQQAQNLIDDLCKNYDRNNQQLADGIADIIRNWERYNEDITEASEEALTQAKNNYTSNMLAIQQQYGTVGLQAQQQLSNNVQSFITTAENIYDNMLQQQQQNLTNLITNAGNLNALSMQNLTLRQAKIEQFQSESMNLNRNQLQNLADQLGMDKETYQDLVNYQVQAVANQLNGYVPGSGMQFQSQIQNYLDQGYTPNQAMQMIMNSADFQAMQSSGGGNGEWKISGDYMYNTATGDWQNLTGGGDAGNYVSYETVGGQTYGVSQKTYNGLANFMNQYNIGDTGGQCGTFVKKYLSSLGISLPNISLLSDKKAIINTPDGYSPQIGDVVVMDSPYAETKKYGHVAIITGVNDDGSFTTLESNQKNNDQKVFSRTINPSKTKVYGYYHPDGVASGGSNVGNGANGPLTDYGVPIDYDRSIKAMIPTQLMNSDTELKKLEENIKNMYNSNYSTEDAVLTYLGFRINNEKDKGLALNLVNAVRSLSNDDNVQSAVSYISQRINAGDYNSAVKKVENLVKAEAKKQEGDGYFDESTARIIVEKVNDILNLANSSSGNIGVFQGTMQKYLKKLKSSEASKLNTAIAYLTDEQRLKQVGSNITEHEMQLVKNWIPQLDDRTDTFINKLNQMKENALTNLNGWRQTYGLPTLDETSLLNTSNRYTIYNGTSNTQGRGGLSGGGSMSGSGGRG